LLPSTLCLFDGEAIEERLDSFVFQHLLSRIDVRVLVEGRVGELPSVAMDLDPTASSHSWMRTFLRPKLSVSAVGSMRYETLL